MSQELKDKIIVICREKSQGDKKMFYVKDIVRWLPGEDRHNIQEAVKGLLDEEILKYWSSGSTTYVMLAEYFPKE